MEAIDFPAANIGIAKNQPQYKTLYGHIWNEDHLAQEDKLGRITVCLKLSPEELEEVKQTGKIWLTQCTFNRGYAPIDLNVNNPFKESQETDKVPMDDNTTPVDIWNKTHYVPTDYKNEYRCENCGNLLEDHYWHSHQCEL
jgi:hypothetical protein